jgi:hypothetical protein
MSVELLYGRCPEASWSAEYQNLYNIRSNNRHRDQKRWLPRYGNCQNNSKLHIPSATRKDTCTCRRHHARACLYMHATQKIKDTPKSPIEGCKTCDGACPSKKEKCIIQDGCTQECIQLHERTKNVYTNTVQCYSTAHVSLPHRTKLQGSKSSFSLNAFAASVQASTIGGGPHTRTKQ